MGSVAFFFMYLLRANLSVAMVCMVKGNIPDYGKDLNTSFLNESRNATEVNEHKDGCGYLQKTQGVTGLVGFFWSILHISNHIPIILSGRPTGGNPDYDLRRKTRFKTCLYPAICKVMATNSFSG